LVYFVSGIGLILNVLLMYFMHGMLHVPAMQAKVISTGIVFIWNFMSRRVFIFNKP
jgi:putative flippase GtrA